MRWLLVLLVVGCNTAPAPEERSSTQPPSPASPPPPVVVAGPQAIPPPRAEASDTYRLACSASGIELGSTFQVRRDLYDREGTRRTIRDQLHAGADCVLKMAAAEVSASACEDILDAAHPPRKLDANKKPVDVEYIALATSEGAKAYSGPQIGKLLAPIDTAEKAAVAMYFAGRSDHCLPTDLVKVPQGGFTRSYQLVSRGGGVCEVEHRIEAIDRAGVATSSRWFGPPRNGDDCRAMVGLQPPSSIANVRSSSQVIVRSVPVRHGLTYALICLDGATSAAHMAEDLACVDLELTREEIHALEHLAQ